MNTKKKKYVLHSFKKKLLQLPRELKLFSI